MQVKFKVSTFTLAVSSSGSVHLIKFSSVSLHQQSMVKITFFLMRNGFFWSQNFDPKKALLSSFFLPICIIFVNPGVDEAAIKGKRGDWKKSNETGRKQNPVALLLDQDPGGPATGTPPGSTGTGRRHNPTVPQSKKEHNMVALRREEALVPLVLDYTITQELLFHYPSRRECKFHVEQNCHGENAVSVRKWHISKNLVLTDFLRPRGIRKKSGQEKFIYLSFRFRRSDA